METVVRQDAVDGMDDVLERIGWYPVHGVELDLSGMTEADYQRAAALLGNADVPVRTIHYDRTRTVSLQEWELFRSQLEMVVERAHELDCGLLSVHPPKAEIGESHTVRDLQRFMAEADAFAREQDVRICFEMSGFMVDPEMVNLGFADLEEPALGAMVDLEKVVDGIDPVAVLEKVAVGLWKVRVPMSVADLGTDLDLPGDVVVVASGLD